jgi:hypothetical protein
MSLWEGPDNGPGIEDTLYVLYYLVPAAEELDLVDELHADRGRSERQALIDEILADLRDDTSQTEEDGRSEPDDSQDAVSLTVGQVIGLLEHYLGAELLHEDEDEPPDA